MQGVFQQRYLLGIPVKCGGGAGHTLTPAPAESHRVGRGARTGTRIPGPVTSLRQHNSPLAKIAGTFQTCPLDLCTPHLSETQQDAVSGEISHNIAMGASFWPHGHAGYPKTRGFTQGWETWCCEGILCLSPLFPCPWNSCLLLTQGCRLVGETCTGETTSFEG